MKNDLVVHILEHIRNGGEGEIPPCEGQSNDEVLEECCRLIDAGYLRGKPFPSARGVYRGAGITGITRQGIEYLEKRKEELKARNPARKFWKGTREAAIFCTGAVVGGLLTKFGEFLFGFIASRFH